MGARDSLSVGDGVVLFIAGGGGRGGEDRTTMQQCKQGKLVEFLQHVVADGREGEGNAQDGPVETQAWKRQLRLGLCWAEDGTGQAHCPVGNVGPAKGQPKTGQLKVTLHKSKDEVL